MIRLIATDVDGTLVPESSNQLDPAYFEAIRQLTQAGIFVVVATGRHMDSTQRLFEPVADQIYFICDNGAITGRIDELMRACSLGDDLFQELLDDAMCLKECTVLVTTADCSYTTMDADDEFIHLLRDEYRFTIHQTEDLRSLKGVIKFSLYHDSDIVGQTSLLLQKWEKRLHGVLAGRCWLDFMASHVSKESALEYLIQKLSVSKDEIITFGDHMNDMGMIRMAGRFGCAVANARPECRLAAGRIIPSMEDKGVLQILHQLIENGGDIK
ncbi:MAG: HAD family hydrolase [Clostridiales bacterium]|nr:HAD family hydrolase [Clostridiales bacterium]